MAENKKSFILYADLIHTVKKMPRKKAGDLLVIILEYVNDENPKINDPVVDLVFEPIKQQLKRDLKSWEETRVERSAAGKQGGIKSGESRRNKANEANASKSKQNEANEAVSVNGTVNVNVNENVIVMRERDTRTVVNAETEILKNPIDFERIVMNAGREKSQGIEILHTYHLYLESKELYPKTKKSVFAGFEKWINDEKKFERNGTHKRNNSNGGEKLGTSEARIDKASKWGS